MSITLAMIPVVAILLALCAPAFSSGQEYRFGRIGLSEGLPQSYVNQITQDARGYIWVGTQDGLGRFDGRNMVVYRHRPGDSTSIAGNNVSDLFLGADSLIYARTPNGLCRFDAPTNSWRRTTIFAPRRLKSPSLQQIHDGNVNVAYVDRSGRLWTASVSSGLSVTDPHARTTYRYSTTEQSTRRLPCNDVWALCEDAHGRMWVGLNGGGVVIIDSMHVTQRLNHDPMDPASISSNIIRFLYEDNIGTMWIGTHGGGLCHYDPYCHLLPILQPTRRIERIQDNFIRGLCSDGAGNLYIGLRTGILQTDTVLRTSRMAASWASDYVRIGAARALHVDGNGRLWIGSEQKGLGFMRKGSSSIQWLTYDRVRHPLRKAVSCIVPDGKDHVLVGTDDGIARVNLRSLNSEWFPVPASPIPDDKRISVSAITRIEDGDYLVGTEFGLYRGQLGGSLTKIVCPDAQCQKPNIDIIRSIEVHKGRAYVATWGGGVRCIDLQTGRERVVDSRSGLPNNTTYAAYKVDDSDLVIPTNAGIILWDLSYNKVRRQITQSQGAQSLEFNSWSHHRIGPQSFAFGGINGMNIFRSRDIVNPPPPTVVLDSSSSNSDGVRYTARAIALSSALSVTYRCTLISSDTVRYETTSPEIVLSTLAPGTYTLIVQASYVGGSYGNAAIATFTIPKRFWQSWWFYLATLLSSATGIWFVATRVTTKREKRRHEAERHVHEERVRIARDLHDDVGTGLAKIVIMAENAAADQDNESIRSIADTAQQVIDSVRSIVWVMKSNDDRLAATIGYIQSKVADLMSDKGISFSYDELLTKEHLIDAIAMRNIVLSTKEIATNIVRHSQASSVSMFVRDTHGALTVELRDNGIGFDPSRSHRGSGLLNIRERMMEIGGRVEISSSNEGTRFVLSVPLRNHSIS